MKVLHIVPESAVNPRYYYSGSTKDILGRVEYFRNKSIDFQQLVVENSDESLHTSLASMPLTDYSKIFIEFPRYPKSMEYIRKKSPNSQVYCRSINAEFYHRLHLYWCHVNDQRRTGASLMRSVIKQRLVIPESFYRLKLDYLCGKFSHVVLPITGWESRNYWRFLVGKKVETLPFYLPTQYEEEIHINHLDKENICVAFMGVKVKSGYFLADSMDNFSKLVALMGNELKDWSFKITGELPENGSSLPSRIEPTGYLETPYPLLVHSRAVAILSPYGFGFKTKILEAILCGCYVLLPPQLKKRLPNVVKPFCISVDLRSVDSFKKALIQSLEPFPKLNPNDLLKQEAFQTLDGLLS